MDFFVGLDSKDCAPVSLMGASLYPGNSHKAYMAFSNPVSALHHDVVPGVAVRASLTQFYQSVFTAELDPTREREVDVWQAVPSVRFQFATNCGGSSLQLFHEMSYMTNVPLVAPDTYELPLLDGLQELWVRLNAWQSPPFRVEAGRGTLLEDGSQSVLLELSVRLDAQPATFTLLPAVPNPFNPSTRLGSDVAESAPVRLSGYNLQGQEVAVLVNGTLAAGRHQVQFTPEVLASGVYVAVLRHPQGQLVQRLTLLR